MLKPLNTDSQALWKQRFRAPSVYTIQLAKAAPEWAVILSNHDGDTFQLSAWNLQTGELTRLTSEPDGVAEGWISADGQQVVYLRDDQGNEHGHLMRVPFTGGEPVDLTPDLPPYTLRGADISLDSQVLVFNPVNQQDGFQVYAMPLDGSAPPRCIHRDSFETWYALVSAGGEVVVTASSARAGGKRHYSLLAFDLQRGEQIAELWDAPDGNLQPTMFSRLPGDTRLLASSNISGFTRPLIWDPRTGERTDLDVGILSGEVIPLDWSPDGAQILLCQIDRASQQLYLYALPSGALHQIPHAPGTYYYPELGGTYFAADGAIIALRDESTHTPIPVVLNPQTGAVERQLLSSDDLPSGRPWRSVTFTSSDGQEIQGWLGVPEGQGPFPAILDMHGGPHSATPNAFSPGSQAWLDHGFVFLTINYRGSTTFGRQFREQIWGDLGHWEVEDIVAARQWLIDQGLAFPDSIFLHGGSYGGYLTLLTLGKHPELWAGGLALAAIGDTITNYEDASEALRGAIRAWNQGTPAEQPEVYQRSSPITYAHNLAAPLLIIQGSNDTRTTPRQMELYVERLREHGKPVEIHWYESGHGGIGTEEIIGFQEHMLDFAYRVLKALPER